MGDSSGCCASLTHALPDAQRSPRPGQYLAGSGTGALSPKCPDPAKASAAGGAREQLFTENDLRLARHGLSDAIPAANDIALPRGTRRPAVDSQVQWHWFDPVTFDLGRESMDIDVGTAIGIYTPERSIIDAFRTRGTEGHELGHEALRRWLRRRGSQPGELLELARQFPRAATPLSAALEALL
jgi:hypothetical protein